MKTAFGPCRVALGVVYAFVVGNAYGATLAPPNGAEQVCVDTHLAVTFDQAPQVGSVGTIRVCVRMEPRSTASISPIPRRRASPSAAPSRTTARSISSTTTPSS